MTATVSAHRRRFALLVLCAGMLMVILDETIVNVALISIQRDLGFSSSGLAWVVNAYLIAFGGLLLLAGRLGDLLGRRRVFVAGLGLFTVASAFCGLATSPEMLIAGRFVQGAGGALVSAVVLGMIVTIFTGARERATAIGAFSFSAAAGASIGLVLGGVITQTLGWHWAFFVNVPIGVAAILVARRALDDDRGVGLRAGADVVGAALVTAAVMLGVAAIVGAPEHGWGSVRTLGQLAVAIALIAAFAVRQATARTPLTPPRLWRSRLVRGSNLTLGLLVSGLFGFQFMAALYLQRVLAYPAGRAGLALAPIAVVIGVVSLVVAPRLAGRLGPRRVLLSGMVILLAGVAWLTRLPVDGVYVVDLLPSLLLMGAGFGLAMPTLTGLAMSDVAERDAGLASGLFNTTQQVSGALGLALAASVAASRTGAATRHGVDAARALTDGYTAAFSISALLVAAALVAAAVVTGAGAGAGAPSSGDPVSSPRGRGSAR